MLNVKKSLTTVLKRMKLSAVLPTLPDRVAYARKVKLGHQDFLELVLQDVLEQRDNNRLSRRIEKACLEEDRTFEDFDMEAPITFDRERVRDLFGLGFIERREDIAFLGPVGVGKTLLACAIGHAACRADHSVLFRRADLMLRELHQCRADNSQEKGLRRLLAPDLLIIDDFGLRSLNHEQSSDLYEILIERHRRSSTIITSNRHIDEWIPLFDDPMLAQSALDRFGHNAYQIVIEGESYRERQRPDRQKKGSTARKTRSRKRKRRGKDS